jgi:GNAT superfamily N-acetyltransferase
MIVRRLNGIDRPPCRCGDRLAHWLNFSGQPLPPVCPAGDCNESPQIGCLIQKDDASRAWHVLPMCRRHQDQTGDLVVSDLVAMVPADACELRADDVPYPVTEQAEAATLDHLLWRVLWQPIGLPRDIRQRFKVDGEAIELAVRRRGRMVGGLSAAWHNPHLVELRHLAVHPGAQGQGLGRRLVETLCSQVAGRGARLVRTIARNTSTDFFRRLGFRPAPGVPPSPPVFLIHGITFHNLELSLAEDTAQGNFPATMA